jgi:hypothetical protein
MAQTNRDRLLAVLIVNVVLSMIIITLPTIILLGIVVDRKVKVVDGDVFVDASLGTILLFSSLAALIIPFAYRNSLL